MSAEFWIGVAFGLGFNLGAWYATWKSNKIWEQCLQRRRER